MMINNIGGLCFFVSGFRYLGIVNDEEERFVFFQPSFLNVMNAEFISSPSKSHSELLKNFSKACREYGVLNIATIFSVVFGRDKQANAMIIW